MHFDIKKSHTHGPVDLIMKLIRHFDLDFIVLNLPVQGNKLNQNIQTILVLIVSL